MRNIASIVEGMRDIASLRGDEAPEVEAFVLADGEPPREPIFSTCSFSAGSGDAGTPPGSVGVLGLLPGGWALGSRRASRAPRASAGMASPWTCRLSLFLWLSEGC